MGGRIISSLGVAVAAVTLLGQPCHAGDRKSDASATREVHAASAINHTLAAPAMTTRGNSDGRGRGADDPLSFVGLGNGNTKSARAFGHDAAATTTTERKEDHPTPPTERKSLTFFRFQSRVGEVSVQPVIGAMKGAQFSLGF